jgi:hypothetical protein
MHSRAHTRYVLTHRARSPSIKTFASKINQLADWPSPPYGGTHGDNAGRALVFAVVCDS